MNAIFKDPRISHRARGVYGFIAAHPDGRYIKVPEIIDSGVEGRDAVTRAITELERYGYLTRERIRFNGRLGPIRYHLHDTPTRDPEEADAA
jgi:DNA-binding MarR family transcriptional regulator